MDLAFFKRGLARGAKLWPEHALLVETLRALQAETPAARAENGDGAGAGAPSVTIADLLLGEDNWREAAAAQQGSFNRELAGRLGDASVTQMTSPFTLAFQPSFNEPRLSRNHDDAGITGHGKGF